MFDQRSYYLILAMLLTASCVNGEVIAELASGSGEEASQPEPNHSGVEVTTIADRTNAAPGETISVWCMLRVDGEPQAPGGQVVVDVTPQPAQLLQTTQGAQFAANTAGEYRAACRLQSFAAVDNDGVLVTISGAEPASWNVEYNQQDCYAATDRLSFDIEVFDAFGNTMTHPMITAAISPSDSHAGNVTHGFRFLKDGDYQVSLGLVGATVPAVVINVHVDATPPVVDITSPTPDAMLKSGSNGDDDVTVSGTAYDANSSIVMLQIAGNDVNVGSEQKNIPFQVTHVSRWGLSVVTGVAEDACGNMGYAASPFLRSPSYLAAATSTDPNAKIGSGFTTQISQLFLDDGNRSDLNDVASLAQAAVGTFDFNAMLESGAVLAGQEGRACGNCPVGPFFVGTSFTAWRHPDVGRRINLAPPVIDNLEFVAGGLEFAAHISNFDFPLKVQVTLTECSFGCGTDHTITVDGWVGLDRMDIGGTIAANVQSGEVQSGMNDVNFAVQGTYIDLDCGALDGTCDGITDQLIAAAQSRLELAVEEAIASLVPPMLADALQSPAITQELTLPAPIDVALTVAAEVDTLSMCGRNIGLASPSACHADNSNPGSVNIAVGAQIYPNQRGANVPQSARGSISYGGTSGEFDSSEWSFAVGMRTDLLNQALWAVWYGGGLDLPDLREALGEAIPTGMSGSVNLGLPPVIMPGQDGQLLELGLGDIQIEATVDLNALLGDEPAAPLPVTIAMTASLVVGIAIDVDAENHSVRVVPNTEPQIYFEIQQINDKAYGPFLGMALGELMANELPGLLGDAVAEIELPSFELSGVPGVPAKTTWTIADAAVSHDDGVLGLYGRIECSQ